MKKPASITTLNQNELSNVSGGVDPLTTVAGLLLVGGYIARRIGYKNFAKLVAGIIAYGTAAEAAKDTCSEYGLFAEKACFCLYFGAEITFLYDIGYTDISNGVNKFLPKSE